MRLDPPNRSAVSTVSDIRSIACKAGFAGMRTLEGQQCVAQGSKLVLEEQPEAGVCGSECKTIAKAALEIVGDHDTDIAEMLWKVWRLHCGHQTQV